MKEGSKDKIINKQKKEISSLKRKLDDLEKEVFTNNKRQRLDSDDIVEDEKVKKLRVHINNIISEYIEILHTERVCLKKYKNNDQINRYINYRDSTSTEYSTYKYESYLLKLDDKISLFYDAEKCFDPNYWDNFNFIFKEFNDLRWFGFLCKDFKLFNIHLTNLHKSFAPVFNKYLTLEHIRQIENVGDSPLKLFISMIKSGENIDNPYIVRDYISYYELLDIQNELSEPIKEIKTLNLRKNTNLELTDKLKDYYKLITKTKRHIDIFKKLTRNKGKKFLKFVVKNSDEELCEKLDFEINTIDDLLKIDTNKKYNFDVDKIDNIRKLLIKIKNFIGLDKIKKDLVHNIKYVLLNLNQSEHMYHMVICGPPGVGKSTIGEVLGEIYCKLGLINSDKGYKFVKASRTDLIGEYLGQTDKKTQKTIDKALGGVLFIDEAYSIGSRSTKDIYAKECLDTLNRNLTEKMGEFVCIIAGYKDELDQTFFRINPGLRSRFNTNFTIDKYSSKQLSEIFEYMVKKDKWKVGKKVLTKLDKKINENREQIKYEGRDMENLFLFCKKEYSNRIFGSLDKPNKSISWDDITKSWKKLYQKKDDREDLYKNMFI
jgi:SpoVK/Ycf46/Vps4 family AAA+-type ATPase